MECFYHCCTQIFVNGKSCIVSLLSRYHVLRRLDDICSRIAHWIQEPRDRQLAVSLGLSCVFQRCLGGNAAGTHVSVVAGDDGRPKAPKAVDSFEEKRVAESTEPAQRCSCGNRRRSGQETQNSPQAVLRVVSAASAEHHRLAAVPLLQLRRPN